MEMNVELPSLARPNRTRAATELWPRVLEHAGASTLSDELWEVTKGRVAVEFAAELNTPETAALFRELERTDVGEYWSSASARAFAVGVGAREEIGMRALAAAWETSGAVDGALGIALHLSAANTFLLGESSAACLRRDASSAALDSGVDLHRRHAKALRLYVTRQYEKTQDFLNGAAVLAFRGTTVPPNATSAPPMLRPLSSFALTRSVAVAFPEWKDVPAGAQLGLLTAEVPAARVLSTPVTGMASMLEHEIVVLGAQRPDDDVEWFVAPAGERVR